MSTPSATEISQVSIKLTNQDAANLTVHHTNSISSSATTEHSLSLWPTARPTRHFLSVILLRSRGATKHVSEPRKGEPRSQAYRTSRREGHGSRSPQQRKQAHLTLVRHPRPFPQPLTNVGEEDAALKILSGLRDVKPSDNYHRYMSSDSLF